MDRLRIPPTYICLTGAAFQVIGLVFLSRVSGGVIIEPAQYGFQVLTAVGNGFVGTAVVLLIPFVMENRDLGVGNATLAQFRILGGAIGISITSAASNPRIESLLKQRLPESMVAGVLSRAGRIDELPDGARAIVRGAFSDGYNLQMRILIGVAAAHSLATALMWKKQNFVISRAGQRREAGP